MIKFYVSQRIFFTAAATVVYNLMIQCKFYTRGYCRNGEACPFSHILLPENADPSHSNTHAQLESRKGSTGQVNQPFRS